MDATLTENKEKNGLEIAFQEKPDTDTLTALKANGFRWHSKKKLWYAKNTPERLEIAQTLVDGNITDRIGGETRPGYMGAVEWIGNNCKAVYGADLAKLFRQEFKTYGIKGVTVRAGTATYTDSFTFTVRTTKDDYITFDEYLKNYTINDLTAYTAWITDLDGSDMLVDKFWTLDGETQDKILEYNARRNYNREIGDLQLNQYHVHDYKAFTPAMLDKLDLLNRIILSYNHDDSNGMVDYFDTNFYYNIDIKRTDK